MSIQIDAHTYIHTIHALTYLNIHTKSSSIHDRTGERNLDTILRLCAIEDWDSEVRLTLKEAAALRALEVFSIAHIEAAGGPGDVIHVQHGQVGLSREQAMIGAAEG